jgi:hypothetical protein
MSDLPSRAIEFHEFCLLTAKPEELRSVIEILDSRFERTRGRRITDQVYKIPPESSGMTLFITTCVGMGHMNAAVRAAQIITC